MQDVNLTYIRRSEGVLNVLWTSYVRKIYVLCPGCKLVVEDCKIFSYLCSFFLIFWRCTFYVIILLWYVASIQVYILHYCLSHLQDLFFLSTIPQWFNWAKAPIHICDALRDLVLQFKKREKNPLVLLTHFHPHNQQIQMVSTKHSLFASSNCVVLYMLKQIFLHS